MAAGFGERQRAEQFARLLDGLDGPRDGGAGVATLVPPQAADPETALMLRVVASVIEEGRFRGPAVRPEFREQLGARLHRDFHELFGADAPGGGPGGDVLVRGRSPWRRRLIGGGVAVGVLSGGIGGVAWAASSALPGDPLYGVKRSLENMRVSVSGSDLERGEQYLGQAKTRLAEVRKLLGRHDSNVDGTESSRLVGETMDNLYRDVDSAGQLLAPLAESGDAAALADLQNFLAVYQPQAVDLETLLSPDSQDKARRLVALMNGLSARMAVAHTNLDKQRAAHQQPVTGATSSARHQDVPATPTPTGTTSSRPQDGPRPTASSAPASGPAGGTPTGTTPGTPSSDPSSSLNVQVPIGSSSTTVTLPPLITGLPPIGITLGNTAPATGPTTAGTTPPNTDPNPN